MVTIFLLFLSTILEFTLLLFAFSKGREWLIATIVLNLLLVAVFGNKLISIFGIVTNAGNIFFASVFLATHMLIEHWGKKEGYRVVWIGFTVIIFFLLISGLTVSIPSVPNNEVIGNILSTFFSFAPRITIASVIAYLASQYFNTWLYATVARLTKWRHLGLRDTASNMGGQLLDSILFFSIAFSGTIPLLVLLQTIILGFLIKVGFGLLGTPVLYITYVIREKLQSSSPSRDFGYEIR